ncbi:MAG: hypothetical protein PHP30_06695 [Bacteroidales bacterium]|nr:hypothetical protein [Bacteroidales bacterium]MDD2426151.1 hypothetical protein [Bacteroidales bacterium]MDD3989762.1 hypothetical protein [Bacteroidales bacterium]
MKQKENLKRRHRKSILLNDKELEAVELYCKKYKISSESKFFREAIISTILRQFEEDHPRLF